MAASPNNVYYIPDGPKNLAGIFTDIDFTKVAEYFVELHDSDDNIIATTPVYPCVKPCDDNVRIHFINYLGGIDAINFERSTVEHDTKSDALQVSPRIPLFKPDHSDGRFNITANDTYTVVTSEFEEDELGWLDELFDAPEAWMEWAGTQGQPASYLPIVISDAKVIKVQAEDRFQYLITVVFTMSNERIIIRSNVSQQVYTSMD